MFFFKRKNKEIPTSPGWEPDPINHRDYRHEEIFGALPSVVWEEISDDPEPLFPIKNQNHSGSCVGNAESKAAGILEYYENGKYRDLSARFIYAQRSNEGPGMYMREGMDILKKQGCPLETLLPSQNLSEEQMNKKDDILLDTKEVALVYKIKNYLYCDMTFDNIASLLNQNIPLVIGVAGTNEGWRNTNGWVRPPKPGERVWHHGMCIPPSNKKGKNFGIIRGKKVLIADNSWGENHTATHKGQTFFTEEYLPWMKWMFYPFSLPDDWREKDPQGIERPRHKFERDLFYGLKNDEEVKWLQKCLKYYGTFPKKIPNTGNFYSVTRESVEGFQNAEDIVKAGESGFGRVGPLTRKRLNELFS